MNEQLEEALTLLTPVLETPYSAVEAYTLGLAWRVLGALATRSDIDIAQRSISPRLQPFVTNPAACFSESIQAFSVAGLQAERAQSLRAWADYERRRGDQAHAATLQQQAQDIFAQLGVKG